MNAILFTIGFNLVFFYLIRAMQRRHFKNVNEWVKKELLNRDLEQIGKAFQVSPVQNPMQHMLQQLPGQQRYARFKQFRQHYLAKHQIKNSDDLRYLDGLEQEVREKAMTEMQEMFQNGTFIAL